MFWIYGHQTKSVEFVFKQTNKTQKEKYLKCLVPSHRKSGEINLALNWQVCKQKKNSKTDQIPQITDTFELAKPELKRREWKNPTVQKLLEQIEERKTTPTGISLMNYVRTVRQVLPLQFNHFLRKAAFTFKSKLKTI